jgi:hypothetical protein
MKKIQFVLLFALFLFFVAQSLQTSAQVQSTPGGGSWNDTLTWVSLKVPGPFDDVIIDGPVDVTEAECNNLFVKPNGILQNRSYKDFIIKVNGTITNNGIIRDSPQLHSLIIYVAGDMVNNNIWSNKRTYLTSKNDQILTFSKEFSGNWLEKVNSSSGIIGNSDLIFKNTKVNLNGATLKLGPGTNLTLYREWMYDGTIRGSNSELYLLENAFIEKIMLDNVAIKGIVNIYSNIIIEEKIVID